MEQTEKQTTDKEQCPHIKKKIGRTTYNVAIHFSKTSRETMTDKINRLILHDINSEDFSELPLTKSFRGQPAVRHGESRSRGYGR